MKQFIGYFLTAILFIGYTSCEKNDEGDNQNSNFDLPELTLLNTIQFTVDTKKNYLQSRSVDVYISGSMMAVDWGDGKISKATDPRTGYIADIQKFTHTYSKEGTYRVKIWSEKLTKVQLLGILKDYSDLHVGNCPVLNKAVFNSLSGGNTINQNGCELLEELELSNCAKLESATLDNCVRLQSFVNYTNPCLKFPDLSKNLELSNIICLDCIMDTEKLPKSIVNLTCNSVYFDNSTLDGFKELITLDFSNNDLTSLDVTDCPNLQNLNIIDSRFTSFDFSKLPELAVIFCNRSDLKNVNVDANKKLTSLYCSGIGLTSLDITKNTLLGILDCSDNKLTTLDVSGNKNINKLLINGNLLDKNELEKVFEKIPSYQQLPQNLWPMLLKITNNPGTEQCDTKIATDKGWQIYQ